MAFFAFLIFTAKQENTIRLLRRENEMLWKKLGGRTRYLCILGGTGFSAESPRIKVAILFLKEHLGYNVITSGLGKQEISGMYPWFEREFVAQMLREHGVASDRIIVGKAGDLINRGGRDDILQILNAVPWDDVAEPELVFLTEGWLHAFRVRTYCGAQFPNGKTGIIRTMNCGPIDWNRRLKEIRSTVKCILWWMTK